LLECTKVETILEFTKQNRKIFKKKLFVFVNEVSIPALAAWAYRGPIQAAISQNDEMSQILAK